MSNQRPEAAALREPVQTYVGHFSSFLGFRFSRHTFFPFRGLAEGGGKQKPSFSGLPNLEKRPWYASHEKDRKLQTIQSLLVLGSKKMSHVGVIFGSSIARESLSCVPRYTFFYFYSILFHFAPVIPFESNFCSRG